MKFVVLRSYDDYISAHLDMNRLKEEDITCYLQNEDLNTTAPFLTALSGGIKLMIPESELERSLAVLNSHIPPPVS
jgi:hypothetical protein